MNATNYKRQAARVNHSRKRTAIHVEIQDEEITLDKESFRQSWLDDPARNTEASMEMGMDEKPEEACREKNLYLASKNVQIILFSAFT